MEKYHVVCTKIIEENGAVTESVEMDETYTGFAMLGKCEDDGKLNEVVMHESIAHLAAMIASSEHMKFAAKLACLLMESEQSKAHTVESLLIDAMMRGAK